MNNKELTFEEFKDVVGKILGSDASGLRKDVNIHQEFGIDSLGLVTLGNKLEDHYDIEIPAADMVSYQTVGEFYECTKRLVDEGKQNQK